MSLAEPMSTATFTASTSGDVRTGHHTWPRNHVSGPVGNPASLGQVFADADHVEHPAARGHQVTAGLGRRIEGHPGRVHPRPGDRPRVVQAFDAFTGLWFLRVTQEMPAPRTPRRRGEIGGVVVGKGARGGGSQCGRDIAAPPGQQHLRLGVTEPDVELEDL